MKHLKETTQNLLAGYMTRKVLLFFLLGLSCGVPYNLLGNSLSYWLKSFSIDKTTIGLLAFVFLPFNLKFLWAPVIDRIKIPFLSSFFGAKKAWGILFQICLFLSIVFASRISNPKENLFLLVLICFFVSFFSASQDIVVDALRIDTLADKGLKEGSSLYQFGYRIGLFITGAGLLVLSNYIPWHRGYFLSSFFVLLGVVALILLPEVKNKEIQKTTFKQIVVDPFINFLTRHQNWKALLSFVVSYKICNAVLGRMAAVFYDDVGLSKAQIALVSGTIGPFITMVGILFGGVLMVKCGYYKSMLYLGVVEIFTSLAYSLFAFVGSNIFLFFLVIVFDNIVGGMGGAVFVAFLSSLCVKKYSATQYALLTSFMSISVSCFASLSGILAEGLGWIGFFAYTGLLMVPALCLLGRIMKNEKRSA